MAAATRTDVSIAASTTNRPSLGVNVLFAVAPMVEGIRGRVGRCATREDGPAPRVVHRRGRTGKRPVRGVGRHLCQHPQRQRSALGRRQGAECLEKLSGRHASRLGRLRAPLHLPRPGRRCSALPAPPRPGSARLQVSCGALTTSPNSQRTLCILEHLHDRPRAPAQSQSHRPFVCSRGSRPDALNPSPIRFPGECRCRGCCWCRSRRWRRCCRWCGG